jgi:hypothetical protein
MVYTLVLEISAFGIESSNLSSGTKQLPLTLNDRGSGFELDGVSLILTGVAKCIGVCPTS